MKTIIFDFDGTLADTLPICFHAFQAVFKEFDDLELTDEEIKAMFGPSEIGIIKENLLHKNQDEAVELYYEKYRDHHSNLVPHNAEIYDLLHYLTNEGYKLAIVTGKGRRSLDISLECLNMKEFFDVMITGDDVESPKPHPEGIWKVLNKLNIEKNDAIFLGDSEADIVAGKAAGVYTIGVHWLPNFQSETFSVKPDELFGDIHDLRHFLKKPV